jgi:hypothetical protein
MKPSSYLLSMALFVCLVCPKLAFADADSKLAVPLSPGLPGSLPLLPQTSPEEAGYSYAGQIVLTDLAAVGACILLGAETQVGVGAVAPWLFASPAVHMIHHNPRGGAFSFLLHAGLPLVAGFIGYQLDAASCTPNEMFCGLGGLAWGGLAGMVAATAIDAFGVAHADAPDPNTRRSALSVLPTVAIARDGMPHLGLAGTF